MSSTTSHDCLECHWKALVRNTSWIIAIWYDAVLSKCTTYKQIVCHNNSYLCTMHSNGVKITITFNANMIQIAKIPKSVNRQQYG